MPLPVLMKFMTECFIDVDISLLGSVSGVFLVQSFCAGGRIEDCIGAALMVEDAISRDN